MTISLGVQLLLIAAKYNCGFKLSKLKNEQQQIIYEYANYRVMGYIDYCQLCKCGKYLGVN